MMEMQFMDYMTAMQLEGNAKDDELLDEQMKHMQLENDMKGTLRNVSLLLNVFNIHDILI